MKKMGFYSYTVGPAGMLKAVLSSAEKAGHQTLQFEENKPGIVAARKDEMSDLGVALLGLDSDRVEEGLELIDYLFSRNIPIVVMEDTPGSVLRPKAKEYTPKVAACLVAMQNGIDGAKSFGYERVEYFGPPPHWGVSYRDMMDKPSRRPEFKKRVGSEVVDLDTSDQIMYVPGTKVPEVVNVAIRGSVDAGKQTLGENFVFHFRRHPGEVPNKNKPGDEERFSKLFEERKPLLEGLTILEPGDSNNPQLIRAADITIFPGGGPTESIVAAYARIPTLFCWNDLVAQGLRDIGIQSGKWFVAELGGSLKVTNSDELASGINSLLKGDGCERLKKMQEKNFPLPKTWDTAPRVVELLEGVAR